MNGRFKRMLEPEERILVRSTDGKVTWLLSIVLLVLCALSWIRGIWGVEFLGFRFWKASLIYITFVPLIPAVAWLWTRWHWVITDRRVLKDNDMLSGNIGVMRNADVDTVRLGDRKLTVHSAAYDWELTVDRNFDRVDVLYDLFGTRMGDSGMAVNPLHEMLEPGENVLWRYSPLVTEFLPWVVAVSGPLALAIVLIWPQYESFLFGGPYLVLLMYVMSLADVISAWRSRGWQAVLTDRRLLRRRVGAPSRCDAVPIDDITEGFWDSKGWELVLLSPGRRDTIVCLPTTARRILDILERKDRGEALA